MRIVGIDASTTATGVVSIVDDRMEDAFWVRPNKRDLGEVRREVTRRALGSYFAQLADAVPPTVIAVEEPFGGEGGRFAKGQKLGIALRADVENLAELHGFACLSVAPSDWHPLVRRLATEDELAACRTKTIRRKTGDALCVDVKKLAVAVARRTFGGLVSAEFFDAQDVVDAYWVARFVLENAEPRTEEPAEPRPAACSRFACAGAVAR